MSEREHVPTVADVLHHMYMASESGFTFPDTLHTALNIEIRQLRALYDQPAPHPRWPTFLPRVRGIAERVECDADALAGLLRQWTPGGPYPPEDAASRQRQGQFAAGEGPIS